MQVPSGASRVDNSDVPSVSTQALITVDEPDNIKPPFFWLDIVKALTKRFCPAQAPPARRVRVGFYHVLTALVVYHRDRINASKWLLKDRGCIKGSVGPSNWPTMTGSCEYSIELYYYRGGRDVEIGDLVVVKEPTEEDVRIVKRVAGLPMYTVSRKFLWFRYAEVTVCVDRPAPPSPPTPFQNKDEDA